MPEIGAREKLGLSYTFFICSILEMRRVSKDDLKISIAIAIKTAPKHVKRGLLAHVSDSAASAMADHILDKTRLVEGFAKDGAEHHSTPS
jgi:hypothetical protein